MANAIKPGHLVVPDGLVGVYRVVRVSSDGVLADIEKFDVSNQKSVGDPLRTMWQLLQSYLRFSYLRSDGHPSSSCGRPILVFARACSPWRF